MLGILSRSRDDEGVQAMTRSRACGTLYDGDTPAVIDHAMAGVRLYGVWMCGESNVRRR